MARIRVVLFLLGLIFANAFIDANEPSNEDLGNSTSQANTQTSPTPTTSGVTEKMSG